MTDTQSQEPKTPPEKTSEPRFREFQVRQLTSEHMNDLVHTYKTFFAMAEKQRKRGTIIDGIAAVGSAVLTGNLFLNVFPTSVSILIAIFIGGSTGISTLVDFNDRANDYEIAGDAYNSLFKEFKEYYRLVYTDESVSWKEKEKQLQQLTERHRYLNSLTPATDDAVYAQIDTDEILENIETTDEERSKLLNTPVQRFQRKES